MPPGLERRDDEPDTPDLELLPPIPRSMKAELKSLSKEHADRVAAHLLAAGTLLDTDPVLAHRHALAAKRMAARLPLVREACAETAYAAADYEAALLEFRALRRMDGSPDYLPVLADCERALGRHQAALRLVAEGERIITDPASRVELRLVQAGVRADMGQRDEAVRLLRHEIEHPRGVVPRQAQARLRYAYADLLLAAGDEPGAREWFSAALRLDPEGQTDALDRLDELDGVVLHLDEDDLDDDLDDDADASYEQAPEPHGAEPSDPEPDRTRTDDAAPPSDDTGPAGDGPYAGTAPDDPEPDTGAGQPEGAAAAAEISVVDPSGDRVMADAAGQQGPGADERSGGDAEPAASGQTDQGESVGASEPATQPGEQR